MATAFPNAQANQAPEFVPTVGFGPGDHAFFDDFTVAWWSNEAPAVDQPISRWAAGSWCFAGQGVRFRSNRVPANLDDLIANPAASCL